VVPSLSPIHLLVTTKAYFDYSTFSDFQVVLVRRPNHFEHSFTVNTVLCAKMFLRVTTGFTCFGKTFLPTTLPTTKSLLTSLLLLLVLLQAMCNAQSIGNIFHESDKQSPTPEDCHKIQRLAYSLDGENDNSSYHLIVDIPKTLSRKNLNVDIDYEKGRIEVFGWWMEQKVRGERPKKICVYQDWSVDLLVVEEDPALLSLYDLVMELKGQSLVLSLPKSSLHDSGEFVDNEMQEFENLTYTAAKNLWKMVRGLARLNRSLHNSTLLEESTSTVLLIDSSELQGNQSSMTYLRSRQDALDRFLKFSLGFTDEESYWLKRM